MLKKSLILLFVLLLAALLSTNQTIAEEGITDTEIHIAQFGPLSGPAKLWANPLYGTELVINMVNEEGGIHGRKIVYHPLDDSFNPAKTKSAVKKMQEKEHIFAWVGGIGTSTGRAVRKYLTKRNIPWIGPFSGSETWVTPPSRNIFALYPHYTLEANLLCRHAVNKMKKERVAIVYLNDDFGKSGLKGAIEGLAEYNQKLVKAIPIDRNTSDMKSIALQLRQAKADTVLLWIIPFHSMRIIMVSKKMKFSPQWMAGSMLSDFDNMYMLSKGLLEDMITANYARLDNQPLIEKYKKAHARLGKKDLKWGTFYHSGIFFGEVLVEGLRRCGPNLTRENLIKAIEGIRGFEGMGSKVNFKPFNPKDPSSRQGLNTVYLQQCMKGGKSKVISDWLTK